MFGRSTSGEIYTVPGGGPADRLADPGGRPASARRSPPCTTGPTDQVASSGALADAMCTIEGLGQAEDRSSCTYAPPRTAMPGRLARWRARATGSASPGRPGGRAAELSKGDSRRLRTGRRTGRPPGRVPVPSRQRVRVRRRRAGSGGGTEEAADADGVEECHWRDGSCVDADEGVHGLLAVTTRPDPEPAARSAWSPASVESSTPPGRAARLICEHLRSLIVSAPSAIATATSTSTRPGLDRRGPPQPIGGLGEPGRQTGPLSEFVEQHRPGVRHDTLPLRRDGVNP